MRKLLTTTALVIAGVVLLSACQLATPQPIPSPTATAIPAVTPTPKPSAPEGLYPRDTRTGIPEVDVVLEAVANEDFDVLKSLVNLTDLPCTNQVDGPPSIPRCQAGMEEGTPIAIFPTGGCEPGYWLSLQEAQQLFDLGKWLWPLYPYAVYRSPRSIEGGHPVAYEVVVAYNLEPQSAMIIFLDSEGRVISTSRGLCYPNQSLPEGIDFILPPLKEFKQVGQVPDAIESIIGGEAQMMLYVLRIASGEDVPCGDPCVRDEDFSRLVQGSIERCQKVEPGSYRDHPDYDPKKHGELIAAYEQACNILISAQANLGPPQETEEWMAAVLEAKAILIRAGVPQE